MIKIYLASGWFNKAQIQRLNEMELAVSLFNFDVYNPRKESIYKPSTGMEGATDIVQANIDAIHDCDFMLISTEGKDMGTLYECGYADANKVPLVFYFPHKDMTFNIMLAAKARAVLTSYDELVEYLKIVADGGLTVDVPWQGAME